MLRLAFQFFKLHTLSIGFRLDLRRSKETDTHLPAELILIDIKSYETGQLDKEMK